MCGICGEASHGGWGPERPAIDAMNATMVGRGPDGEGVWMSESMALGHRRLAVIDPEGGQQPMVASLGSVALSFSGEIYNQAELRTELQALGHDFRTTSDTEVILNGYLQYGEGVVEKLRGMFAFAVADNRDRNDGGKLLLARDRLGIKPLCYSSTQNGVVFGSVPQAVLAHPNVEPLVGIEGWREHFAVTKTPGRLIWNGIQEVKPGTTVTVDPNGIREQVYWHLESRPHTDDYPATVKRVRSLLEEIVDEQLIADVEVGMLLSGGVDSSTLTALAARSRARLGERIASYAVDFPEHAEHLNSELLQTGVDAPFAQEVAEMWGTDHTRFVMDSVALASRALREQMIRARDLGSAAGDSMISRMLLFERIREHSTAVLSGEVADELFGGYNIFFDPKVTQGSGWPWKLYSPQASAARLERLNPDFRRALELDAYIADAYADAVRPVERLKDESAQSYRMRQINFLEITRHAGFLLDFTDRLSASVGLEVRVPFTDHRLIEYVYNVPWGFKASGGRVKGLLKDVAKDLLPQSVLDRTKSGYPLTPHPAYLREIQRQARELVSQSSRPVFDIVSREWLERAASKPVDQLTLIERDGINEALELDVWLEVKRPTMV